MMTDMDKMKEGKFGIHVMVFDDVGVVEVDYTYRHITEKNKDKILKLLEDSEGYSWDD